MSAAPVAVRGLAFAAALSLAGQTAAQPVAQAVAQASAPAASAFPRSSIAPSPYTGRPGSPSPAVLAGAPPAPASLPEATPSSDGGQTLRIDLRGPAAPSRMISLPKGKSAVIELPVDARDVLVSDPKVADVVLSTPRRIYVLGVGAGQTDAVFFDAAGRQLLNLNVRVDQDVSSLAQTLSRLMPGSGVKVEAINDHLVLSGQVANLAEADRAAQLARSLVTKPEQVINMLSIAGPEQVMLRVRIVEVDRTVIKQLGFNLNAIYNQIGEPQYSLGITPGYGVNGSLLGGLTGGYKLDTTKGPIMQRPCGWAPPNDTALCDFIVRSGGNADTATVKSGLAGSPGLNQAEAMLQAFERVGLVRTLAEPNLTAVSGEAAKFLAGGEFPVPTGRDNNGSVTIEFKPYGVGLGFTPVVLSSGRISLKVSTEFSEISNIGAFSINTGGSVLTVPGLSVRRAETLVELPSGGAMMIAGLLQNVTKSTIDSLPGMMQLPVLGSLFRSRDFLNNESELVVIITPYLVKPTRPDEIQTPADGLQIADDLQTVLLGRLNKAFGRPAKAAAASTYQGPYGYVVD